MKQSFVRESVFAAAGLLIWAADFLFIYVFAALACARGFAGSTAAGFGVVQLASALSTLIAFVAAAAVVVAAHRCTKAADSSTVFRLRVAFATGALGLIAIAITGMPGVLVRATCA